MYEEYDFSNAGGNPYFAKGANTVLCADFDAELAQLRLEVQKITKFVNINLMCDRFKEPVKLGVQWHAIGTVSASETVEFAQKLIEVSKLVESFKYNGYIVVWC